MTGENTHQPDRRAPPWPWTGRALILVFIVALALRLLNVWFASQASPFFGTFNTDDAFYNEWAQRIAGGELSDGEPFFLSPLFPYALAFVYKIFGDAPLAAILLQVLISSVTCCLIMRAGQIACGNAAGLFAGLLAALYGPFIFFTEILLTETLHLFLAMSALTLFLERRGKEAATGWFGRGLICGLAAVTRTYFLLTSLLLAVWIVVEGRSRTALNRAALFLAGVAVVAAIPTIHNAIAGKDFVIVNSSGGINFFMGNHEGANGRYHVPASIPVEDVQTPTVMRETFRELAEKETGQSLKPSEVSSFYYGKGLAFIAEHPGEWLGLAVRKLAYVLESYEYPGDRNFYQAARFSPVLRWTPGRFPLVLGLALLGIFSARRRLRRAGPVLVAALAALAVLIGFYVTDRYRLALVLCLLILAGEGAAYLWGAAAALWKKTSGERRALPLLGGIAAASAVFCGSLLLTGDRPKESYMSLHNLAVKYLEKEQFIEAVETLQLSVKLQPDFLPARSNLALALSNIPFRREEAIAAWQSLYSLAREKGQVRYMRRAERWLQRLGVLLPPEGKRQP
jgi:4-amino-4-deoxy-L-arabinose transferase-like glycosyltransferase